MSNLLEQYNELSIKFNQRMNETDYENGMMWMYGPNKCRRNAKKFFTRAANNGCEKSKLKLEYMLYKSGQDKSMDVNWLRKAADQGDPQAQSDIGVMYKDGKGGLPQSDALALEWLSKAADQGDAKAQFNLGYMYAWGKGVPKSIALAVEWLIKAAEEDYAPAQCSLGRMYDEGKGGLPQSGALAVKWYRKAADQGNAHAQHNLGGMYATGEGVPRNLTEALWWFRKAHAQGLEQAAAAIRKVSQEQRVQQGAAAINPSQLPTTDVSPSPIPIGTRVELDGLKAKKLNRQRGEVVGFDLASGRCEVKLDDGRGPYRFKPDNLKMEMSKKERK